MGDLAFFSSLDCSAAAFVYKYCKCGKLAEAAAAAMIWLLELFEGYFSFLVGGSVLTSLLVLSVAALSYVFCKFSKLAAAAFAAAHDVDGCHDFISSVLVGLLLLGLFVLPVGVSTVLTVTPLCLWVPSFCSISTSACLEVDPQRKKKSFVDPFSTHLRSKAVRLILLQTTIRVQVSTASSVACLWAWGRLPDGWTSLTMPRSQRQPHLKVLFVPGQVVWMRLGGPVQGRQNSVFSEGL